MHFRLRFSIGTMVAFSLALPVDAIMIRHDVDDALYQELAKDYPQICHMNLPDGEGALIADNWVITAAHLAADIKVGHKVTIAGNDHTVAGVFAHSGWNGGKHDLALVKLREPVKNVKPAVLYREKDEAGKVVVILGAQDTGNGKTGPIPTDHKVRGATNVIDEATTAWLKFGFDEPPSGTPLEGVAGGGDSGGPAFIQKDGIVYLLGVGSGQSTKATGGKEGVYGVIEHYVRVSTYIGWIERTIKRNSDK
jgi:hypothetical protein